MLRGSGNLHTRRRDPMFLLILSVSHGSLLHTPDPVIGRKRERGKEHALVLSFVCSSISSGLLVHRLLLCFFPPPNDSFLPLSPHSISSFEQIECQSTTS